jgi:hypothetical protein
MLEEQEASPTGEEGSVLLEVTEDAGGGGAESANGKGLVGHGEGRNGSVLSRGGAGSNRMGLAAL